VNGVALDRPTGIASHLVVVPSAPPVTASPARPGRPSVGRLSSVSAPIINDWRRSVLALGRTSTCSAARTSLAARRLPNNGDDGLHAVEKQHCTALQPSTSVFRLCAYLAAVGSSSRSRASAAMLCQSAYSLRIHFTPTTLCNY